MSNALELVSYATLAEQVDAMQRDGYVYVPGFLGADEIAELRRMSRQLEPIAENLDINLTLEKDGHVQKCINTVFNRDPLFLKYSDKPGVIELAEAVHGSDCHMMQMHNWLVGPGRPDQQLHADYQPYNLPADILADPRVRMPIYITTAHAYLVDMTEELGPTKLIPGSHLSGRKPNKGETTWNGAKERSFLAKRATASFSAAKFGTVALPTAPKRCATPSWCIMPIAWSRRSSRPI